MKIYFSGYVFLRNNKESAACGHPVDRIQVDDFVSISYEKTNFEPSREDFLKWSEMIDYNIKKYLNSIFDTKVIFGKTKRREFWDSDLQGWASDKSEVHAIRVDDIRNIVMIGVEEHKTKTFEEVYEISL